MQAAIRSHDMAIWRLIWIGSPNGALPDVDAVIVLQLETLMYGDSHRTSRRWAMEAATCTNYLIDCTIKLFAKERSQFAGWLFCSRREL